MTIACLDYSPTSLDKFSTLVELLQYRSRYQSDRMVYTFLPDGETEAASLTHSQLARQARAIAARLQSFDAMGERVLLLYPPGLDFIAAFFGCLYAGAIAIPAYPPRQNQNLIRLQAIVSDAKATFVLTTTSILENMQGRLSENPELAAMQWFATDCIEPELATNWQEPDLQGDSLAFLQYTSGSTGTPKGVMVSHQNLLHNLACMKQAFAVTSESVSVSWLPSFHDMGLIDGILQPLYSGFPGYLMPPIAFLQQPIRWLRAIDRYKGTHCGAPNFAYDLCTRKVTPEQRETIDLSSWHNAYNGAEPVRKDTLEQFARAFKVSGLRSSFLYPCYGLAEATLMVSGGSVTEEPIVCALKKDALEQQRVIESDREDPDARLLVGSGRPVFDTKVVIVRPDSLTQCAPDEVGEIWVSGASVAGGYWNRTEQTERTFQAYLKSGEGPFLRTGDLGFVRNGELFVTGRLKDVIIIRGRNHYPQDIELTIEKSHPALKNNASAAFALEIEGSEQLAIACEVERTYLRKLNVDEVVGAIRKAVSQEHELQVYAVLLLKTASIPKTSSGKIQRHACKVGFQQESLDLVGSWMATSIAIPETQSAEPIENLPVRTAQSIQNWLVDWLSRELKLEAKSLDPNRSFAEYGLDSVSGVELAQALGDWLGIAIEATAAWDFPTINVLSKHLAKAANIDSQQLESRSQTTDSLDELSESEIARLLAQEIATVQQGK